MWMYQGKELTEVPEGYVSFVYIITNLTNNRIYVGKKTFVSTTSKVVNGKKKKTKKESTWKKYWGSNDQLKADVKELGPENFKREILHLCVGIGIASYLEAKEQFARDVLLTDSYNNWISVTSTRIHVQKLLA